MLSGKPSLLLIYFLFFSFFFIFRLYLLYSMKSRILSLFSLNFFLNMFFFLLSFLNHLHIYFLSFQIILRDFCQVLYGVFMVISYIGFRSFCLV